MNLELIQIRLNELQKQHGMSQIELAHKLNVHRNSVNGWMKGYRAPDTDTVIKLSKLFNVSADYILGLSNKK